MNIFHEFKGMTTAFPKKISNEWIKNMPRLSLSEEQKQKPYAKYYERNMTDVPQKDLDIVNLGTTPHENALSIFRAKDILTDGYLKMETGFSLLYDGTAVASSNVFMANVTPKMIDWWFNWHPLDGLRYMIWCPVAHADISAKEPDLHKDSSSVPLGTRNVGRTHYPVEGFQLNSATTLDITFHSPKILGITKDMLRTSSINTQQIAVVHGVKPRIPVCVFFHAVREVAGGIEYRSHYWVNMTYKNGKIQKSKIPFPKSFLLEIARNNCIHSLIEYNHLASILPELYAEEKGLIL